MNQVIAPMIVEIGIISYRTMTGRRINVVKNLSGGFSSYPATGPKRPPLPSELVAVFVVFGVYSVIGGSGENVNRTRIAALLSWGTVLATFLSMYSTGTSSQLTPGTFPSGPTLSQRGQLTQPLPNLPNVPPGS